MQLAGAVDGPDPRPGDRNPPAAQGDRPGSGAMPVTRAITVVLAARPAQRRHVLVHDLVHHLQADPGREGQQALPRRLRDPGQRHDHLLGHGDLAGILRVTLVSARGLLIGLAHGGSLPRVFLVRSPVAYHSAGSRWGTATLKFYDRRDNLARTPGCRCREPSDAVQCPGERTDVKIALTVGSSRLS